MIYRANNILNITVNWGSYNNKSVGKVYIILHAAVLFLPF